eukprot:jgi/Astpho2/503/e_gw1.00011.36.1_t
MPGTEQQPVLEDSDDDFKYEEVEVISENEEDAISEDLDAALHSLQTLTAQVSLGRGSILPASRQELKVGEVSRRPELVDDFIRNFLVRMGLSKTLELFETEWYELKATGRWSGPPEKVPDLYAANLALEEQLQDVRKELLDAKTVAGKASATWDKFRKERDFHRMHHKRVAQEKNRLISDLQRLKKHYSVYEPTIEELRHKYEAAMKEKMLVKLEKDRLAARSEALQAQVRCTPSPDAESAAGPQQTQTYPGGLVSTKLGKTSTRPMGATLPVRHCTLAMHTWGFLGLLAACKHLGLLAACLAAGPRDNPMANMTFAPMDVKSANLQKTFKGHTMSVSNLALHPTKPIVVTASDDRSWKMWHLPRGDLIMAGEGHKDWVAGISFHPKGTHLASGAGDSTVKLWSFEKQKCVATYSDHTQAVWGVAFHDSGNFVASCSLDHSVRLWDVTTGKCRQSLRGHVDSVNEVAWQPYSSSLLTASSDKTVSIWDARSGLCTQTFYGHHNSCSCATFNLTGLVIASTDADGVVKLWDVRMVAELLTIDSGEHPANKCSFDRSGEVLAVASENSKVMCYNSSSGAELMQLHGHDDAVQAVLFDHVNGEYMVTAASDCTFRLWS